MDAGTTWLSEREIAFLHELDHRGVRYLVVGMSAAILQGVPGTSQERSIPAPVPRCSPGLR